MMKKRITALALTLALCLSMGISAANASNEALSATLNRALSVTYNGIKQAFYDATGAEVYPLSYNNTTYLPVRALSGLVGLNVSFDGATNTVALTSGGMPAQNTKAPTAGANETISAELNRTMTVTYDGAAQKFTDANGAVVYPISYAGTTYLPVRAVSGLLKLPVDFNDATNTVVLGTAPVAPPSTGVSTNLFDNQVSINGTVMRFPNKMENLAALGFVLPEKKKDFTMNPNTFTSGAVEAANGDRISGGFYNLGATTIQMSAGMITDVAFAQTSLKNTAIIFAGGIQFGASQAEVTAAYGAPTEKRDGGTTTKTTREVYKYNKGGVTGFAKDFVEILFENGKLARMEIYTNEI